MKTFAEIAHFYLNTGLKIKDGFHAPDWELKDGAHLDYLILNNSTSNPDYHAKPYLRPLSQLTEEIEHNGERFVPIEWLEDKYYTLDLHTQAMSLLEKQNWLNHIDFILVQQLLSWHINIFNLSPDQFIEIK